MNILTDATVSGTLLSTQVAEVSAEVALNPASVSSPPAATNELSLLTANAASGLLNIDVGATAAKSTSTTNIDGLPGSRSATGSSELTAAYLNISLGSLDLLSLALHDGTGLLVSSGNVSGGGGTALSPFATSNLLSTNSQLDLSVLGLDLGLDLSALTAGVALDVGVNLDTRVAGSGTVVQGLVTLLADETLNIPSSGTSDFYSFSRATGLQVALDLSAQIYVAGFDTANLGIRTNVTINQGLSLMYTPEPGRVVCLILGLSSLAARRRQTREPVR